MTKDFVVRVRLSDATRFSRDLDDNKAALELAKFAEMLFAFYTEGQRPVATARPVILDGNGQTEILMRGQ